MSAREPYKFWVATVLGMAIVVVHIGTSAYLWFIFAGHASYSDDIIAAEVTLPLTVAYVVSVVKWFLDTRGKRTTDETYGWPLVVLIGLVGGAFLLAMPVGIYLYMSGAIFEAELLNQYFLFVESSLGAMFALIFADMFGNAARGQRPAGGAP